MIAAKWLCTVCSRPRDWGTRAPTDNYWPMLRCENCRKLTRHVFQRIADREARPARAAAAR